MNRHGGYRPEISPVECSIPEFSNLTYKNGQNVDAPKLPPQYANLRGAWYDGNSTVDFTNLRAYKDMNLVYKTNSSKYIVTEYDNLIIGLGNSHPIKYQIYDEITDSLSAPDKYKIEVSSDNKDITLDNFGTEFALNANKPGKARITLKSKGLPNTYMDIEVLDINGIYLETNGQDLSSCKLNKEYTLKPMFDTSTGLRELTPEELKNLQIHCYSSNFSDLNYDRNTFTFNPSAPGNYQVEFVYGNFRTSCDIFVMNDNAVVQNISMDDINKRFSDPVNVGESYFLNGFVNFTDGTSIDLYTALKNNIVTFVSQDPTAVTYNDGSITFNKEGSSECYFVDKDKQQILDTNFIIVIKSHTTTFNSLANAINDYENHIIDEYKKGNINLISGPYKNGLSDYQTKHTFKNIEINYNEFNSSFNFKGKVIATLDDPNQLKLIIDEMHNHLLNLNFEKIEGQAFGYINKMTGELINFDATSTDLIIEIQTLDQDAMDKLFGGSTPTQPGIYNQAYDYTSHVENTINTMTEKMPVRPTFNKSEYYVTTDLSFLNYYTTEYKETGPIEYLEAGKIFNHAPLDITLNGTSSLDEYLKILHYEFETREFEKGTLLMEGANLPCYFNPNNNDVFAFTTSSTDKNFPIIENNVLSIYRLTLTDEAVAGGAIYTPGTNEPIKEANTAYNYIKESCQFYHDDSNYGPIIQGEPIILDNDISFLDSLAESYGIQMLFSSDQDNFMIPNSNEGALYLNLKNRNDYSKIAQAFLDNGYKPLDYGPEGSRFTYYINRKTNTAFIVEPEEEFNKHENNSVIIVIDFLDDSFFVENK